VISYMSYLYWLLTRSVGGIFQVILSAFLLPLWIAFTFGVPILIGRGLSKLVFGGRSFQRYYSVFQNIGDGGCAILFFYLGWAVIIQIFSTSAADWWCQKLFLIGVISNIAGAISAGVAATLGGE